MMRSISCFLCSLSLLSATAPSAWAQKAPHAVVDETDELNLSIGENRSIPADDVKSFSEGVHGVADVKLTPDNSQFIIVGQKAGSTTLLLLRKDGSQLTYTITVSARPMGAVQKELSLLLQGTTGIRIRRIGSRYFVEGGVSSEAELKRIEQIARLYAGQVESLVVLGGAAADRRINVRVDFYFVQYDRSRGWNFGVSYPRSIGPANFSGTYDFVARTVSGATASITNQPLLGLDMGAVNGWAKILKHSTVVTANGTEAKFESGGEQNFIVSSGLSATLNQIHFGTNVTVLPRFDPATRELEVNLQSEVMDLTPPVAAGTDLPGRNISKLDTKVALKLGQSIVLSGIRTRSQRHEISGIPILSEIPLLGVLFGTHSDTQAQVEGAIFVVPTVVESVSRDASQVMHEALSQYADYSGDMDELRTYEQDPGKANAARGGFDSDAPAPKSEEKAP